jgi:hypothetical protein
MAIPPKTKYLLFFILGFLAIAVNIVLLLQYSTDDESFRVWRRIISVLIFGIWTGSYFVKYRRARKNS